MPTAVAAVLLVLTGYVNVRETPVPLVEDAVDVNEERGRWATFRLRDGRRFEARFLGIQADTLRWRVDRRTRAVPLGEVCTMTLARRGSVRGALTGAAVGAGVLVGAAATVRTAARDGGDPGPTAGVLLVSALASILLLAVLGEAIGSVPPERLVFTHSGCR